MADSEMNSTCAGNFPGDRTTNIVGASCHGTFGGTPTKGRGHPEQLYVAENQRSTKKVDPYLADMIGVRRTLEICCCYEVHPHLTCNTKLLCDHDHNVDPIRCGSHAEHASGQGQHPHTNRIRQHNDSSHCIQNAAYRRPAYQKGKTSSWGLFSLALLIVTFLFCAQNNDGPR